MTHQPSPQATEKQLAFLAQLNVPVTLPLSKKQASILIEEALAARSREPATEKQKASLRQRGINPDGMTKRQAWELINRLFSGEPERPKPGPTPLPFYPGPADQSPSAGPPRQMTPPHWWPPENELDGRRPG